jgi:hypothetical protein
MATSIRLKKSAVSSNAPTTGDIDYGELAINYNDGKLYYKTSSDTIDYFGASSIGGGGYWTLNGSDVYYNTGNVGIGVTAPGEALEVDGNIEITGDFIGDLRGPVTFKAQASENLTLGDVVYISGVSGQTPTVGKADADDATKMPAFGLVSATTTSGNPCTVVTFGTFIGYDTVNTPNSPTWALGDTLYVSTTAGGLTNVAPTGESSLIQNIGKVQRIDATDGRIKVGGAGRTNATPNLNEGRLFVGNASNQAVADGTIHVDIANTRVGINDTTPSYTLDVNGTFRTTGNSIIGDGVGDTLTINAGTIDVPSISAGTDNTVLVYNGTSIVTDEIDSRVWGSTLVDGSGTTNKIAKWSDSNTIADSTISDDGSTVSTSSDISLTTANSTISGATGLTLEETGDTYGTVRLKLQNRTGVNGALFEQAGSVDLVDFVFKTLNNQANIRLEDRSGFTFLADPEFQIGEADDPTFLVNAASTVTYGAYLRRGRMGIGTATPSYDLDVNGTFRTTGNTTLGDASGDSVTINAATIALANVAAGTDNTVLVYNGSSIVTDEIDSRVWGSTLVDGSGTATYVTKWSDSNTVTDSLITDDGSTVTIGGNLTVNGTTTTLNATNSVVTDNLFELNSGVASNANDSGIIIERGSTGNNALFIWDESADKFAVGTTTATADSTGNITYTDAGLIVGTLDISGAAQFDSTLTVGVDDTGHDVKFFGATSGSYMLWDESTDDLILGGDSRLGIGVTSTSFSTKLHVENTTSSGAYINYDGQSNAEFGLRIESNAGGGNFESDFVSGGTALLDLYANSASVTGGDLLVARTQSATPVMLVKGNGNVGIGTSSPMTKLHVFDGDGSYPDDANNHLVVESDSHSYIGLGGGTSSDVGIHFGDSGGIGRGRLAYLNGSDAMAFNTNGAERMRIDSAGNVGIGDSTPDYKLDVNGTFSSTLITDDGTKVTIDSASNGDIELVPNGTGVVVFKGDATKGSGQFKLNCEQNSHAITIKGPPHSAAASYTLVLPNDDGTTNQVLTTDGSGNLSWTTPSGSYGDSDVNTHLNQSSAGSGEVLSWSGSDYEWVANAGTSGGTSGTSDRIVSIDAGALVARSTNGAAAATEEYATNDVMSDHFLFDGATEEGVQFRFNMPPDWDGNAVNAKFYWDAATGASAADGVTWGIAMQAFQNDDALDNAFGTSVDTDDAVIALGDLHVSPLSADITIAGSPSAGDLIIAEVTRVVGDANDTMTEDAKLLGVTIHYTASVSSQVAINAQTGTTYTTVLTDASKLVTLNNASAITLTIPPNSSVAYPVGTKIDLLQIGAGQVTVAGGSGVTVNSTPTLKLRAQYSGATCIQYAADTWILAGDLAAS